MSAARIGFAAMGIMCLAFALTQVIIEGFPAGGTAAWASYCSFWIAFRRESLA